MHFFPSDILLFRERSVETPCSRGWNALTMDSIEIEFSLELTSGNLQKCCDVYVSA